MHRIFGLAAVLLLAGVVSASPPVASYIFPAGGQRGTSVPLRVGGLFLHERSEFSLDGAGVTTDPRLKSIPRIWFEGPVIPLPDSQQAEDYPVDRLTAIRIDKDAPVGSRRVRISTSQGVATGPLFVVGELPEVIEQERDGDPLPQACNLPVTANGRIFPRGNIDLWSFTAKRGESITAFAVTAAIRSPLQASLEIVDSQGKVHAESGSRATIGADASVRFTAPTDGTYMIRIGDIRGQGGPAFVYRLTITNGLAVDSSFPLGGRRGGKIDLQLFGQAMPPSTPHLSVPVDSPNRWTTSIAVGGTTLPITLDIDDLPEFINSDSTISPPATLNGKVDRESLVWKLELNKAKRYEFDLRARQLGSPLCGVVTVKDSTGREVIRQVSADPGADPFFTLQPPADGVYTVVVEERFRNRGGPAFAYRLMVREVGQLQPDFRLKLAGDAVNVPRGGSAKVKVTADNIGGFNGPIELDVSGLPQGVHFKPATIAPGQASTEITLSADPLAVVKTGTVTITGRSGVEAKRERVATFSGSSTIFVAVAVPTPFRFEGQYTMNNSPRGQPYSRQYELERNGFEGLITISLADRQIRHLQGVTGPTITVTPDRSKFEYAVQLPPWIEIGRTSRSVIMAVGEVEDADGSRHTVCYTSGEQNHQLIVVPEPGRLGIDLSKASMLAAPGKSLRVPFQISRAKDLRGEVVVESIIPAHWTGVSAAPVRIKANQSDGELELIIASDRKPSFNMPLTVRARLGTVVAETKLELLQE